MSCPSNSIRFNSTLCACPPGQVLNPSNNSCNLFAFNSTISTDDGIDSYTINFPAALVSDSIKNFAQSQAVFLEATFVLLLSWLFFCFFLRFKKLGDGRSIWFKIRWWISRLDICFATRHWLDDRKVVVKRKTELGGTFSIASWIVFIGLFSALLYQIISKRSIEVHNVRATNGPDLASFMNDMEFNITTVSSMSCSNVRDLGTLLTGSPGLFDQRTISLSNFANYSCHNTSEGPTINLKCSKCQLYPDNMYISWQFIDILNSPASAVGFRFTLTARNQANMNFMSSVSGTLKNGSGSDSRPVTYRGKVANVLKFNIFPRIYHHLHDLKLMQPLFHEFVPGSYFQEANQLRSSLENPNDGQLNVTLYINLLSAYIVEIDRQNIMGPLSFFADLGGLYCISIGLFFYLLVQFEYRVKRLRNEDSTMQRIRSRRKAQDHWAKLRKYVIYTWGCYALDKNNNHSKKERCSCCFKIHSNSRTGSSLKKRRDSGLNSLSYNSNVVENKKTSVPECSRAQDVQHALNSESRLSISRDIPPLKHQEVCLTKQHSTELGKGDSSSPQLFSIPDDHTIPPLPTLELKDSAEMDMSDVMKNMRNLYEYNAMLREKFVATQSLLHELATKSSRNSQAL